MKILEQMVCQPRRLAAVALRTGCNCFGFDASPIERSRRSILGLVEDGIGEYSKRRERARPRAVRGHQALPDLKAPISSYDDKCHSGQNTTTSCLAPRYAGRERGRSRAWQPDTLDA